MANAIEIENVSVHVDGLSLLEGITTAIPQGKVSAIIGPNGAGKTTLLRAILGLMPFRGEIKLISSRGRTRPKIGYVPQQLEFDRGVPITVLDFLAMSKQRRPLWFGVTRRAREIAMTQLQRVQAEKLVKKPIGKLSGGEFQRVQLALALQDDPEILLLDEPVSGVDIAGERMFCDMLDQIHNESKLTMVMVSHDLSVVSRHAQYTIFLNRKLQCAGDTLLVLTPANLKAIYGPHIGLYEHEDGTDHGHSHSHGHFHSHGHHHHH